MIKILQVLDCLATGGIQSFIMNVYERIDKSQYQFDFLVTRRFYGNLEKRAEELGAHIYVVPPRRKGIIKNKRALKEFFSAHNDYAVVHEHESSLSYLAPLKAAKAAGIPKRIIHAHSSNQSGIIHHFAHYINRKKLFKIVTDVFVCSDLAAQWFLGKNDDSFTFIPNGIKIDDFLFSNESRQAKLKELDIGADYKTIGLVGRLAEPKNHKYLIDVFDCLCSIDKKQKYKLLLIGGGGLKQELEQYAATKKCFENILFLGDRSDAAQLFSAMDLMIMPSINEGLPVTLVEAQAAGLPCLVSENVTKMVKVTDLLCYLPLSDGEQKWAIKARELLRCTDREKYQTTMKESVFNIENVIKKIENEYKN